MNIDKELAKQGLTLEQYDSILKDIADKKDGITDLDWSDICDKYNLQLNKDSIRKMNDGLFGGYFVKKYMEQKIENGISDNEVIQQIEDKKRELSSERIRVQDEKRANSKYMRAAARHDRIVETFKRELQNFEPLEIKEVNKNQYKHNEASLLISDLHYGISCNNYWNKYDTSIAKKRMEHLTSEVIRYCKVMCVDVIHIELLGDLISGFIHKTLEIENEVNVINQVIECSEILAQCINIIANNIPTVNVYITHGNHSRTKANYKENVEVENFEYLIWEFLRLRVVRDNVNFIENDIDTTFIHYEIEGEHVFGVHGHLDKVNSIAQNFSTMFNGMKIKAIHCGHLHHEYTNCVNGIKVVMNSTASGVDEHSKNMRYVGKPSQTLLVYDNTNTININIELE